MEHSKLPENGALVKFRRLDDDLWRDGEYDAENHLFIEIYAPEITTHNVADIAIWQNMHDVPTE